MSASVDVYPFGDERDAKYIRLIGYCSDVPKEKRQQHPCTRIELINTMILAAKTPEEAAAFVVAARDALMAKVEGYEASYAAAQEALRNL